MASKSVGEGGLWAVLECYKSPALRSSPTTGPAPISSTAPFSISTYAHILGYV